MGERSGNIKRGNRKQKEIKVKRRGRGVPCVDRKNYRLIGKKKANKIRLFEQILGTKTRDGWMREKHRKKNRKRNVL